MGNGLELPLLGIGITFKMRLDRSKDYGGYIDTGRSGYPKYAKLFGCLSLITKSIDLEKVGVTSI